jgi:hypothetical protein
VHSLLCIHEIYLCIHAIGVSNGVTLQEFEGVHQEEDQEQLEELEVLASEGVSKEELPECPDRCPSFFLKGKPQCMLTQLIYK